MAERPEPCPRCAKETSRREYTEQWYAVRIARLTDLAKEHGIWPQVATILANGTAESTEPPTYAQQLNLTKYRAEKAEAEVERMRQGWDADVDWANKLLTERDEARAEVERWKAQALVRSDAAPKLMDENDRLRSLLAEANKRIAELEGRDV